jgi:hypothetical protein
MAYRRDPLAATRRENTRDRMRLQRENMTGADVEAAMEKIIRAKLEIAESISLDDFRRANLPIGTVQNCFKLVLARVQHDRAGA